MTAKIIRYIWSKFSSAKRKLKRYVWNFEGRLKTGKGVYIPDDAEIFSQTEIGDYTRINGKITIRGGNPPVKIGKYCAFGYDVTIINDFIIEDAMREQSLRFCSHLLQFSRRIGNGSPIGTS